MAPVGRGAALLLWLIASCSVWQCRGQESSFPDMLLPKGHPYFGTSYALSQRCNSKGLKVPILTYDSETDLIGKYLRTKGAYEPEMVEAFVTVVSEGLWPIEKKKKAAIDEWMGSKEQSEESRPAVLDVGCNVGIYSLCALQQGIDVVAVEANPPTAHLISAGVGELLKRQGEQNFGKFVLFQRAVGDSRGAICLVSKLKNAMMAKVITSTEQQADNTSNATSDCTPVTITTLDSIMMDGSSQIPFPVERVVYMKMDVEGHELLALRGGVRYLRENPPCAGQVEFTSIKPSPTLSPALQELSKAGYCVMSFATMMRRLRLRGTSMFIRSLTRIKYCDPSDVPVNQPNVQKNQVDAFFFLPGQRLTECLKRVSESIKGEQPGGGGGRRASDLVD